MDAPRRWTSTAGMLAVARSLPAVTGASIEWHEGSVLSLPFPDAAFDVVLCQLGLQFFPDRRTALADTAELHALVVGAGYSDVTIRTTAKQVRFASGADYVRIQLAATPLSSVIAAHDPADREHVVDAVTQDVCAALSAHLGTTA
jgi:SAM-dependent methyltransferase